MAPFITASDVVAFWKEAGPENWFAKDEAFDAEFRARGQDLHLSAARRERDDWIEAPETAAELPPEPTATTTTTPPPAGPTPGSQADFLASVTSDTIHFDTDRFNVDAQSQTILQSQAQWLARYPGKQITIEGHCDERGTRDYNLALGERRANSAKAYLVSLGVDASRINLVSYVIERPIPLGSD